MNATSIFLTSWYSHSCGEKESRSFWATAAFSNQPNAIDENRLMADLAEAVKSAIV